MIKLFKEEMKQKGCPGIYPEGGEAGAYKGLEISKLFAGNIRIIKISEHKRECVF
jgi:hypothetical protein